MKLTPRGAVFFGTTVALTLAGLVMIDGVLFTLGLAGLLLLIFVIFFGYRNLAKLELSMTSPKRIFADTLFDLRLTQRNHRDFIDAYRLTIELKLSKTAKLKTYAPWTAARSTSTAKIRGSFPHRGNHLNHPCLITSTFPLDLFNFQKNTSITQEILIFPKPLVPQEFFANGEFDDAWSGEGHQAGDAPGEPRTLRPFRPGDRAKHIHWPATIRALARGKEPIVREYDPPGLRPQQAAVIFHSYGTDNTLIRTDLFERALSLTCGTLRHLRNIGVPTTLHADFLHWKPQTTFQPTAWNETLTALARAQRSPESEAHDLTAAVEAIPAEQALVIISDMPTAAWQHILPSQSERPHLIIDINQHRFHHRGMKVGKTTQLTSA